MINPRLFAEQLCYIINHAEDKVVFVDGTLLPLFERVASLLTTVEQYVLFNVELVYGGVFRIEGFSQEHMLPLLFIECPRLLFPFARQIVADATRNGGFPPLMLDPIDFAQMFQQKLAEDQKKAKIQAS